MKLTKLISMTKLAAVVWCLFFIHIDVHAQQDFDRFIKRTFLIADGFDSPPETSSSSQIFVLAHGRVHSIVSTPDSTQVAVLIEHDYFENHYRKTVYSQYYGLQNNITVRIGDTVKRGQLLGKTSRTIESKPISLHEQLPTSSNSHEIAATAFLSSHRQLFNPQEEPNLILVDQSRYRMRLIKKGLTTAELDISLGQAKGQKQVQGDNKTPKGMYFITQKYRGTFPGKYGAYYGGHWMKINYPNAYDAARGVTENLLSETQLQQIRNKWERRLPTLENTRLGGGIGFHGWVSEWDNKGSRHLSWGCVVMHISDISHYFEQLPVGSMVIIF